MASVKGLRGSHRFRFYEIVVLDYMWPEFVERMLKILEDAVVPSSSNMPRRLMAAVADAAQKQ
jgi:hypothetical protein